MENLRIEARRNLQYSGRKIELHGFAIKGDGGVGHIETVTITDHRPDDFIEAKPFMRLDDHQAQILMDSLWDCGIRPSEGQGSAGQLAAVKEHLNDMRAIVFKGLKDTALKVEATRS